MQKILTILLIVSPCFGLSQQTDGANVGNGGAESPIKFAFYSSAWGQSGNANLQSGLRLVVENQTESTVELESIEFVPTLEKVDPVVVTIDLVIPAGGLAEQELPYTDLMSVNDCVSETLTENWRLVEISNYTLNPSVRRLIIEDTTAFRIYQCVSTVNTYWVNINTSERNQDNQWVLYHFESNTN